MLLVDHSVWEPVAVVEFVVNLIIFESDHLHKFLPEETASLHTPLVYVAILIKGIEIISCFARAQVEVSLTHAHELLGVSVKERHLHKCEVSQQQVDACVVFIIVEASDLLVAKI